MVHDSLATLSDTLFTTAIAVYSLAMVCYTAEYAFGRRGRIAATSPAKELVGAGGPPVGRVVPSTELRSTKPGRWGRFALILTIAGAAVHTGSVAVRGLAVDRVPWGNMYEFATVVGLLAVLAFLAVLWRLPTIRHLGGFVLLPVIMLMFLAGTVLYAKASPLVPALQSYWLAIHVSLAASAEGVLITSAVCTLLFMLRQRYDRVLIDDQPMGRFTAMGARLPEAAVLDKAAYRTVAFAFPVFTVGVICGAIWAEAAWGRYWGWDPKETWAFIAWVIYAAYLHARATAGWKGRSAAWINLAGFGAMTFNFFIVNIVISGLHSYAGLN